MPWDTDLAGVKVSILVQGVRGVLYSVAEAQQLDLWNIFAIHTS